MRVNRNILWIENAGTEGVSVKANRADEKSEIFRLTVPGGLKYILSSGEVFQMKLYDSTKTEISRLSRLWLVELQPLQETPLEIAVFDYAPWFEIPKKNQYNEGYADFLRVVFPGYEDGKKEPTGGFITLSQYCSLIIELKSPDIVSWAAGDGSFVKFDIEAELV